MPASAGIPRSRIAETVIAPFNEPDVIAAILEAHAGEIAAILVEPVQFNIGVVPPNPGFLERLRELADEHGIVLIFDEVKTGVVLAYGGAYEYFGVQPDLFCLAKSIGGGIPIGAFGGKREVMGAIETLEGSPPSPDGRCRRDRHRPLDDPGQGDARSAPRHVQRQPAVDGGRAGDAEADPDQGRLSAPARDGRSPDRRQPGGPRRVRAARLRDQRRAKGLRHVHARRVTNYRDFIGLDSELWAASFFYLANRGILLPPGPDDQWTLSVQHTEAEVDRYVAVFREFAVELMA